MSRAIVVEALWRVTAWGLERSRGGRRARAGSARPAAAARVVGRD